MLISIKLDIVRLTIDVIFNTLFIHITEDLLHVHEGWQVQKTDFVLKQTGEIIT